MTEIDIAANYVNKFMVLQIGIANISTHYQELKKIGHRNHCIMASCNQLCKYNSHVLINQEH